MVEVRARVTTLLLLDANLKTAIACHVRSAPTLLLFKDGAVQATQVGLVSKTQLRGMLDAAL